MFTILQAVSGDPGDWMGSEGSTQSSSGGLTGK